MIYQKAFEYGLDLSKLKQIIAENEKWAALG